MESTVTVVSKGNNSAIKMQESSYTGYSEVYRDGETITRFTVKSQEEARRIKEVAHKNDCICITEDL